MTNLIMKRNRKGFTLIEIIVCIVLIALVATISIISIRHNNENEKKKAKFVNDVITNAAVYYDKNIINEDDLIDENGYTVIKIDDLINDGLLSKEYYSEMKDLIDKDIEDGSFKDSSKILVSYDFENGMRYYYYPYNKLNQNKKEFDTIYLQKGEEFDCNKKEIINEKILKDESFAFTKCDSSKIDYEKSNEQQYVYFNYSIEETDNIGKTYSVTKKAKLPVLILPKYTADDFNFKVTDNSGNEINDKLLNNIYEVQYNLSFVESVEKVKKDNFKNIKYQYEEDEEEFVLNSNNTYTKSLNKYDTEVKVTPKVIINIYPNYFGDNVLDSLEKKGTEFKYYNKKTTYNVNFYIKDSYCDNVKSQMDGYNYQPGNGKEITYNYYCINKKQNNKQGELDLLYKYDMVDSDYTHFNSIETLGFLDNLTFINLRYTGKPGYYYTFVGNIVDGTHTVIRSQIANYVSLYNFKYDDKYLYSYNKYSFLDRGSCYNCCDNAGGNQRYEYDLYDKFELIKDGKYFSGITEKAVERAYKRYEIYCKKTRYEKNYSTYNNLRKLYQNSELKSLSDKPSDFIKQITEKNSEYFNIKYDIWKDYKNNICQDHISYCCNSKYECSKYRYFIPDSKIGDWYEMLYEYEKDGKKYYIFAVQKTHGDKKFMRLYKYSYYNTYNIDVVTADNNYNFIIFPNMTDEEQINHTYNENNYYFSNYKGFDRVISKNFDINKIKEIIEDKIK